MRLNNAVIVNRTLDGIQVTSTKDFIRGLLSAKDLVADVFVNTRLLFTCVPSIREDNCWLIAYVDGRFALSTEQPVESILVKVHQKDSGTIIFESLTPINNIISVDDVDADLNFGIMSTSPNSTMKCNLPDSRFQPLLSDKLSKKTLSSQPSVNSLFASAVYPTEEPTLQIVAKTAGAAGNKIKVTFKKNDDGSTATVTIINDGSAVATDDSISVTGDNVTADMLNVIDDADTCVTFSGKIDVDEIPAYSEASALEIQLTGGEDSYYGA